MRSLQLRLSLGLLASLVLVFLLQWLAMNQAIRHFTESYLSDRLAHDAEALLAALQRKDNGWEIDESHIDPIYRRPFDGHYYVIVLDGKALYSPSLWDATLEVPGLRPGQSASWQVGGPMQQELLVQAGGYRKDGADVVIAVAEEVTSMHADIRRFQWTYAGISLLVMLILIGLQRRAVKQALNALDVTREDVRLLEQGRIRQLDEQVPEEIRPLVGEVNRLLRVMNLRLERSRNALGNLAHALKQPLMMLVQLGSEPELQRHPAILDRLDQATRRLQALVERELKRARLAGTAAPGQHFSLEQELSPLLETLRSLHRDKDLKITCEITGEASFAADREDMLELFGNLLDNACKHAASRVVLTVHMEDGLQFHVEDDGPGLPDDEMKNLAERGVRIDEDKQGHGLGLSIVRDIVLDYGGEIGFGRSGRLGGFRVSVTLPAVPWQYDVR